MNDFTQILHEVVSAEPFNGSQRALARAIDVDHTHLSRVLAGERDLSPKIVGRVAKVVPKKRGNELIKAYLQQVAIEISHHQGEKAVRIR